MQRTGLAGLALLGLGAGASRVMADPELAPGQTLPPVNSLSPEVHNFKLGGVEAYVILDGALVFPAVQPAFAPEATPEQLEAVMQGNFETAKRLALSVNVLVLKLKSGVVIFDAGAGAAFGAAAGRLVDGLKKIGLTPEDVKLICVTHAHGDHIGGLLDAAGKPVFSLAKIVAAQTEVDFWTAPAPDVSKVRLPAEAKPGLVSSIQHVLTAVKSSLERHAPGAVTPEIEMIPAPGHTPGHAMFRVTIGGESLLVIGDAVHVWAAQFDHPEWSMIYDVDPALAISTRQKLFHQAATERTFVHAYHLPFPGLGHVRPAGSGYQWVPRSWV
jgi:glyoxylase-like metal-dependent hydrolase (beta-lactamase superfamily II)